MTFIFEPSKFLPFRDAAACEAARSVTRGNITRHHNPDFRIRVEDDPASFYSAFAIDIVDRIRTARDESRDFIAILPVGPVPQYELAAQIINDERLSLSHVTTFNMDEYANEHGETAPHEWAGSFRTAMWQNFFNRIDPELRPNEQNIHFPSTANIDRYSEMIEDAGGADVCYGGVGWSGHIAFWEPQLGYEFSGDLDAYRAAPGRMVELHPMTIMQNALHSFGSDWSWVPPMAATIGPRDILGARHRSFWLDGAISPDVSWQRFIARLAAHGPISEFVPASFLQETRCDYTILGSVADDVKIAMA
jgi:glucosamine-6-phosphate deaminase